MNTTHYSITINAPREKVWDALLGDATYREWTSAFMEGSFFRGSWEEGSEMLFLGPGEDGKEGGMYAKIAEQRPHEFVSIEHLGEVHDGVKKPFEGEHAFENYTLTDIDGKTEVAVDMSAIPNEYLQMMDEIWPKALEKLKEIAER